MSANDLFHSCAGLGSSSALAWTCPGWRIKFRCRPSLGSNVLWCSRSQDLEAWRTHCRSSLLRAGAWSCGRGQILEVWLQKPAGCREVQAGATGSVASHVTSTSRCRRAAAPGARGAAAPGRCDAGVGERPVPARCTGLHNGTTCVPRVARPEVGSGGLGAGSMALQGGRCPMRSPLTVAWRACACAWLRAPDGAGHRYEIPAGSSAARDGEALPRLMEGILEVGK